MSDDATGAVNGIVYPEIEGFIVELIVPPALESRARECMARAPEVKISVDERMTGDVWLAVTDRGRRLEARKEG